MAFAPDFSWLFQITPSRNKAAKGKRGKKASFAHNLRLMRKYIKQNRKTKGEAGAPTRQHDKEI